MHVAQNLHKKHSKPSILIVDDEHEICALTTRILQKEGYEVSQAQSQHMAFNLLKEHTFQLCLLDVNLSDGNGFEIVAFINSQNIQSKVIMMSAYEGLLEHENLEKHQVKHFLKKPFSKTQLLTIADSLL